MAYYISLFHQHPPPIPRFCLFGFSFRLRVRVTIAVTFLVTLRYPRYVLHSDVRKITVSGNPLFPEATDVADFTAC